MSAVVILALAAADTPGSTPGRMCLEYTGVTIPALSNKDVLHAIIV